MSHKLINYHKDINCSREPDKSTDAIGPMAVTSVLSFYQRSDSVARLKSPDDDKRNRLL